MSPTPTAFCPPDLSGRPFSLAVERRFALPSADLFEAWTECIDRWFAAPGSVLLRPEVNAPFYFETAHAGQRHPHYGRILRLEPDRLIELTWVTGAGGTEGAETVVTVALQPVAGGTLLHLTHAGFADEASLQRHEQAWPFVLEQLESQLAGSSSAEAKSEDFERVGDEANTRPIAPVIYDELEMAFDFVSSGMPMENSAYVSLETGAIEYRSEFDDKDWDDDGETDSEDVEFDNDRFIAIPHKNELDLGRALVMRFADEMLPGRYEQVEEFFRRRGAYARFKDLLASEGLLERWYAFEADAQERALREWCADNRIPLVEREAKPSP